VDPADHVALLKTAVESTEPRTGSTWADIGAGTGAFTLALADLLGPGASIVAVDRDRGALERNAQAVATSFPETSLTTLVADFTRPLDLDLPVLDGLVCANSLHFVGRATQVDVIRALAAHLKPDGRFVVVEYDADSGNPWVPHPFSSSRWPALAAAGGLRDAVIHHRVPSRFLGAIYSASAIK